MMAWEVSDRFDPKSVAIADRHYSRQKPGTPQFVAPGSCLVLWQPNALWVTSWPKEEFTKHAWAGAWVCSLFRNEGAGLSSSLITEAVAATAWKYPTTPDLGMVTFIDTAKVRAKRDPGYCFLRAGFKPDGYTKSGLLCLRLWLEDVPAPVAPLNGQLELVAS